MSALTAHGSQLRILRADVDLDAFDRRLQRSDRRLLMLDYDGTLAPFVDDRSRAFPYDGVRDLLAALIAEPRNRVVIVSGRAVEDLRPLLGLDPLPEIWGSHGWERLHADGSYEPPQFVAETRQLLDAEWHWLEQEFPSSDLERKPASVALHWRAHDEGTRAAMRSRAGTRWSAGFPGDPFDLHHFDGGVELRVKGKSKGDAVAALLAEEDTGAVAAYFGDDRTDEDAFAVLAESGLRVLVRREWRETLADVQCIPPLGLLNFLHRWREPRD